MLVYAFTPAHPLAPAVSVNILAPCAGAANAYAVLKEHLQVVEQWRAAHHGDLPPRFLHGQPQGFWSAANAKNRGTRETHPTGLYLYTQLSKFRTLKPEHQDALYQALVGALPVRMGCTYVQCSVS